jgi:glycosyltransferase involved in cell wall biosynthesis
MRIALDYTSAITEPAGIGRYTRGLAQALAHLGPESDTFTFFTSERLPPDQPAYELAPGRVLVRPIGHRNLTRLWHRLHIPLPAELLMGACDLIHGPDFVLPPALLARRVVTIHDLAYRHFPEAAQPRIAAYLDTELPRALRAADHIIAVSEATARDLVEQFSFARERISVIYPGVDAAFTSPVDDITMEEMCRSYQLTLPFILAVGTIEPRKNYGRLIRAFAEASLRPDGPPLLVFAGRRGWLYDDVLEAASRADVADRVRFLGYVPDHHLPALYRAATALAMPSLYEGFGIPIIEAMATGTPVICSTAGALPEVVGDAAILVDPLDVEGLSDALLLVFTDATRRRELIERGKLRSRMFSWDASAEAHLQVYRRTIEAKEKLRASTSRHNQ